MPGSRISSKGQVTIPQEVRERLGLRPGDRVEFVPEAGRYLLQPERRAANTFRDYIGAFPAFSTREEINSWVRELREDDRSPE
jgi:antitoxin PrlF